MGASWLEHRGKRILVIDYSNIKMEKEMIAIVNAVPGLIKDIKPGEELLAFIDLTNAFATPGFLEASKKMETEYLKNLKLKRAIIGVTGAKAVLLKGYNLFLKTNKIEPFSTREEALAYLVK